MQTVDLDLLDLDPFELVEDEPLFVGVSTEASARALEHLPNRHRQEDHAGDGVAGALDKLKGAGRIDLQPGERLLRSDRTRGEDGRAWLAVTEKDGKRSLRIGLGNAKFGTRRDYGGPWRAGPDRTAEIDEERAEMRALMEDLEDEIGDLEDDPDADPARLAELRAQLDEYEDAGANSDVEELPGGYTAILDEASARQLRETLAKALDDGETLHAQLDAPYQELDRLTLQRDKLKRKAMGRKFTAEEDAEWDRLTAEISRAEAELDPTSGPERPASGYWTLAEGSIPGQWADVHYDIYLDDPDVGVEVKLGAVPHGSDMDFEDMRGAEMTASFAMAEADEFVRLLNKLISGFDASGRASEGVTALLMPIGSPAVRLMVLARAAEASDVVKRRGKLITVERGKGGKFAKKGEGAAGAVAAAVDPDRRRLAFNRLSGDIGAFWGTTVGQGHHSDAKSRYTSGESPQAIAATLRDQAEQLEDVGRSGRLPRPAALGGGNRELDELRLMATSDAKRLRRLADAIERDAGPSPRGGEPEAPAAPVEPPTKPAARRSAVAKALASGNPNALDGIGREALRREAKARGLEPPRGVSEDVLRDMLWDDENASEGSAGRAASDTDREADAVLAAEKVAVEIGRLGSEREIVDALAGKSSAELRTIGEEIGVRTHRNMDDPDQIRKHIARSVAIGLSHVDFRPRNDSQDRGPAAAAPKAPRKRATDVAQAAQAARRAEIDAIIANPQRGDREKLRGILGSMTVAQLNEVAKAHGFRLGSAGTKSEKVDLLVESTVGNKLNSEGIRRGVLDPDGGGDVGPKG